jgi:hypothetical protein
MLTGMYFKISLGTVTGELDETESVTGVIIVVIEDDWDLTVVVTVEDRTVRFEEDDIESDTDTVELRRPVDVELIS